MDYINPKICFRISIFQLFFFFLKTHLLQLFLNATKYNKNVLKHSVQLYLFGTITIILLLFCNDSNKTYLSQALQSSQEKYLFAALWYSRLRFDSGLALGMWNRTSDFCGFIGALCSRLYSAHSQQTHIKAAATHLIVRTKIRTNIKAKFKGSLPVWQEKAWILELSFLSCALLKYKNLTNTQKSNC